MNDTTDSAAQVEVNQTLLLKQAPLVALLNGLTDEQLQWRRAFGLQDYMDEFGDLIPKGRTHYRQGEATNNCLRLSTRSMEGVLKVMLSNRLAINLAKRINAERLAQLHAALDAVARPQ